MITPQDFSSYEKLPIGIFITKLDMNFIYVNQYACDMFGYDKEVSTTLNGFDMVTEEDVPIAAQSATVRAQGGTPPTTFYTGKRADGSTFPMQLEFIPQIQEGELVGFLGVLNNVTKLHNMQVEIASTNDRYTKLMNNLGEIVVIAQNGCLVYGNNKALGLLCIPHDTPIEEIPFTTYIDERDRALVQDNYRKRLSNPEYKSDYQFRILTKDSQSMWVKISSVATEWNGKPATLSILTDIDHRVHIMEQLAQEKERAEQAMEMESRFLANVSHEIRTPMNGILGISSLLLDSELTSEQGHYVEMVQHSAQHLLRVINDVLDYSAIEAGKMTITNKPFSLQTILKQVKNVVHLHTTEKELTFALTISPDTPQTLLGDSTRIIQILTNLISNAIKFTPKGSITLDISYNTQKEHLLLTVSDTGVGIPDDAIEAIFRSFAQVENPLTSSYEGTGLGLTITKELVELMGGTIECKSVIDQGTRFEVLIPAKVISHERSAETSLIPIQSSVTPHPLHVLVVEDNMVNFIVLKNFLLKLGCTCDHVADGYSALDTLELHTFDAIFMDIQMPGIDGYETTKRFRERQLIARDTPTPIVAITANAMASDKEKCLGAGMDYYISKPIDAVELQLLLTTLSRTITEKEVVKRDPSPKNRL